jgi:hypothetical protein
MGDSAAICEEPAHYPEERRIDQSPQSHIANTLERICKKLEEKVK